MKFMTKTLAAALFAFGFASGASALSVTPISSFGTATGAQSASGDTLSFSWSTAPYTGYVEFTFAKAFDLFFSTMTNSGSDTDISGYTLDFLDGGSYTRLTTATVFCVNAVTPVGGAGTRCNTFAKSGATGGNAANAAKPGDLLFASLDAGQYRLGIYESGTPSSATATFTVVAPVPLPAGAVLMFSGFGLLAFAARRRKV